MNNSITTKLSPSSPQTTGSSVKRFIRDSRGLSTVEYVILLALIAVGGIALWQNFGTALGTQIKDGTTKIDGLSEGSGTPVPGL